MTKLLFKFISVDPNYFFVFVSVFDIVVLSCMLITLTILYILSFLKHITVELESIFFGISWFIMVFSSLLYISWSRSLLFSFFKNKTFLTQKYRDFFIYKHFFFFFLIIFSILLVLSDPQDEDFLSLLFIPFLLLSIAWNFIILKMFKHEKKIKETDEAQEKKVSANPNEISLRVVTEDDIKQEHINVNNMDNWIVGDKSTLSNDKADETILEPLESEMVLQKEVKEVKEQKAKVKEDIENTFVSESDALDITVATVDSRLLDDMDNYYQNYNI